MRVYVPTTVEGLAAYARAEAVPSTAERFVAAEETEEAEYEALSEAADAATAMLDGPGRRVVVVAEVADEDDAFGFSRIDAVHADTDEVDPAEHDEGDLPELGWFATQEIPDLIG